MDWLIWVIVIVLIVAIVWWLLSRNNARNSSTGPLGTAPGTGTPGRTGTAAPAAMEPSDTMSMPDTAAAVAGVAGLAGVTNMGKAAAEGSGPVESSMESRVETEAQAGPPVDEPVIETPEVDEPVVDEPVVDTDAQVTAGDVDDWEAAGTPASEPLAAEPAISEPAASGSGDGVTADDVTRADDTPKVEESADTNAADKAEWESSWTDAGGTAIHHHEYTDAHSATLAGAETAAAEMDDEDSMTPTGHLAAEHPYGVGSASAAADGSGPEGYPVKADASTMTYHDEDTAGYDEATADVWFESAAHAEAAGFRPPPEEQALNGTRDMGRCAVRADGRPATGSCWLMPARTAARLLAALLLAALSAACTGSPSSPGSAATPEGPISSSVPVSPGSGTASESAPPAVPRKLEVQQKLDAGLQLPWSIVFLPDGTAIVSERDSAQVKSIRDGRTTTIGEVAGVEPGGEGGLLGLALSPAFASNRWLYAYFTSATDNRIARMHLSEEPGGALRLGGPEVVFSGISKASTHNGGRIRFGPDGFLYVGTGDSQRREQPQDTHALGGKILRLTPEGRPAPGNPFGENPVYSYGHRNVQGLAWDNEGRLWASEFGPDVDDELNLITPGGNYGWPTVTGAPGRSGFIDAKVVWPSTSDASPSGLEIADGVAYTGALRGQRLWAIPLNGNKAGSPVAYFTGEYGRLRDVAKAPDGTLWVLSNNRNPDFALILRRSS